MNTSSQGAPKAILTTRDTVAIDTPARRATSAIVGRSSDCIDACCTAACNAVPVVAGAADALSREASSAPALTSSAATLSAGKAALSRWRSLSSGCQR